MRRQAQIRCPNGDQYLVVPTQQPGTGQTSLAERILVDSLSDPASARDLRELAWALGLEAWEPAEIARALARQISAHELTLLRLTRQPERGLPARRRSDDRYLQGDRPGWADLAAEPADHADTGFDIANARRPATCILGWEGEHYCRWAGKRLPTDVEWNFAARSRRSDDSQPWGTDRDAQCKRSNCTPDGTPWSVGERQPSAVCSYPEGNSVDGLCDMMGNVAEHVEPSKLPGWKNAWEERDEAGRGRGSHPRDVEEVFDLRLMRGRPDEGFRCARDLGEVLQ